jgi:hypothetical protein
VTSSSRAGIGIAKSPGGIGIRVGDNTTYRQNIQHGAQCDANIDIPFSLSQVGTTPYKNVKAVGVNFGGNTDLFSGVGFTGNSVLIDRDVSDARFAVSKTLLPTGANSVDICSVELKDNYTSALVEIVVNGLNGGVSIRRRGLSARRGFREMAPRLPCTARKAIPVRRPISL